MPGMDVCMVHEGSRKLKANDSNPDAPDKKNPRNVEASQPVDIEKIEGMPEWAVVMQRALMSHTTQQVQGLRIDVDEAMAAALQAQAEVRAARNEFQDEVRQIREQITEVKELRTEQPAAMRKLNVLEDEFKKMKSAKANAPKTQSDQEEQKHEKRTRTVTFGQFPKDTKASAVKDFILNVMEPAMSDVEEVFAFGKTRAERGAARFKTTDSMWKYMMDNSGNHKHLFGSTHIYCNADSVGAQEDQRKRERGVRKVVRMLIEQNGGNGEAVKQYVETDYRRGVVWFKDQRVAEWRDNQMHMVGEAVKWSAALQALLEGQ